MPKAKAKADEVSVQYDPNTLYSITVNREGLRTMRQFIEGYVRNFIYGVVIGEEEKRSKLRQFGLLCKFFSRYVATIYPLQMAEVEFQNSPGVDRVAIHLPGTYLNDLIVLIQNLEIDTPATRGTEQTPLEPAVLQAAEEYRAVLLQALRRPAAVSTAGGVGGGNPLATAIFTQPMAGGKN